MEQQPETSGKYYLIKPAHISEDDTPAWVQEQMSRILAEKKAVENLLNLKIEGGNDGE